MPRFFLRDNDILYPAKMDAILEFSGVKTVKTPFHAPNANPFAERVIGTLRRECLDHIIIMNERHLRAVLTDYIDNYYNVAHTHMSLNKDSPVPRPVQPEGKITSKPILGGLHHIYTHVA